MSTRPDIADVIVDFDHHGDEFNLNECAASADLRRRCPVAYNERYGGFWFVTGYDVVSQAARDHVTFAHKYEPDAPDGVDYQGELGVPRPQGQPALGIGEVDGGYHEALRRALAPHFAPRVAQRLRPFTHRCAHWFLDQRIGDGEMDLVLDYASPVPAIITMNLMGLPLDSWRTYANLFHAIMAAPPDSDEYGAAIADVPAMMADLLEFTKARRAGPRLDLTSFLTHFEFDGKALNDAALLDILWNLIAGGVDTTTSQTALTLRHLATHDHLRRQLIASPDLYRTATDEFLRYFSVNQQLSRTVARDTVLGGQRLHRNDRVVLSWLAANHDEREFDRPDEVVLDRAANSHIAFGLGPHRCIGSHLARVVFEEMVKAVLERIPDYEVKGAVREYLGNPAMTGLATLPVTFSKGVSRATARPW